jgi:hypothetical protein
LNYKYILLGLIFIIFGIFSCKYYILRINILKDGIEVKKIIFKSVFYYYTEIVNYYYPTIVTLNGEYELKKNDHKTTKLFEENYEDCEGKDEIYFKTIREIYADINYLKDDNTNWKINILTFVGIILSVVNFDFQIYENISIKKIAISVIILINFYDFLKEGIRIKKFNNEIKTKREELKNIIENKKKAYFA